MNGALNRLFRFLHGALNRLFRFLLGALNRLFRFLLGIICIGIFPVLLILHFLLWVAIGLNLIGWLFYGIVEDDWEHVFSE